MIKPRNYQAGTPWYLKKNEIITLTQSTINEELFGFVKLLKEKKRKKK